jgi:hypothetical protein
MMPRNESNINGFPSNFKQALKPDALSASSSSIGVAERKKIANTAMTI